MKSFDEWWKTEGLNTFDYPKEAAESGFEAGQQSKQAEVDELRKRIDEAIKMLEHSNGYGYEQCTRLALNILKGNQND